MMQRRMFIVRPEVVSLRPRLDDGIKIKRGQCIVRPRRAPEQNIGVEHSDLCRALRQPAQADALQTFLVPGHCVGADRNMGDPLAGEIGEFIAARAVGAFD